MPVLFMGIKLLPAAALNVENILILLIFKKIAKIPWVHQDIGKGIDDSWGPSNPWGPKALQ